MNSLDVKTSYELAGALLFAPENQERDGEVEETSQKDKGGMGWRSDGREKGGGGYGGRGGGVAARRAAALNLQASPEPAVEPSPHPVPVPFTNVSHLT